MNILVLTHIFSAAEATGEARIVWEYTHELASKNWINKVVVITNFIEGNVKSLKKLEILKVPFSKKTTNFDRIRMLQASLFALPIIFWKKIDIIHLLPTNVETLFEKIQLRPLIVSADFPWDYTNPKIRDDLLYDRQLKSKESLINEKKNLTERAWGITSNLLFKTLKLNAIPFGADIIFCRQKELVKKLKQKKCSARLFFLPNGVNTRKITPILRQKSPKQFTFGFLGKISKRKGMEYAIDAFKKLYRSHKNIELIAAGQGSFKFVNLCKDKVKGLPIKFIGKIEPKDIIQFFQQIDVMLYPLLHQGSGLSQSQLEALSAGMAIISTNGEKQMFTQQAAIHTPLSDAHALSKAMSWTIKNKNKLPQIKKNARKYVINKHSWAKLINRSKKEYQSLLTP